MLSKKKYEISLEDDLVLLNEMNSENGHISNLFQNLISLSHLYDAALKEINTKLEILDEEFSVKYDHNPIHSIESRIKRPNSILNKLRKEGIEVSVEQATQHLTDIAGVRVICNYVEDVYTIAALLLKQDDIELVEAKDYIKNPKESGYRSYHAIVNVPVFLAEETRKVPVEIQFRSIAMDFWASLEHQLRYKTHVECHDDIAQELIECAEIITDVDQRMQSIFNRIHNLESK
ncbi:GTP pyrophosphokinase [Erysipelothrix larvae]|uniref:GTP pyrophosphokinase n=1 Tax=Erysipelothrix larvae TaxID=1514105 RepID=A0A0X8H1G9_9FIRM|nr:GTP pyrophosphokinase family protein [Erysipelothrix larvae]AMC94109.1 GTP pyrophosphokinase [Erysipelothrix larvae]